MKNKKILIVEDEQIIAENLRFILNGYGYDFVDVAMDVTETKELFEKTPYDLVIMDINLGETSIMDGIDLIKDLSQKYSFPFIFVTANSDEKTIKKAKETRPASYIIKPFVGASIYANVEMILNTSKEEIYFTFSNNQAMQKRILVSEITYIEAEGAYFYINQINGEKHLVRMSLIQFMDTYSADFIRIHKSVLVNKNHIQAHTSLIVKVKSIKLPLGRAYKEEFLNRIKEVTFSNKSF
jgi:DNA-binding LytR/AlgR family response regulator